VQIDLDALPDDPAILQRMLREVVAATTQQNAALSAENDKLRLLIQRLTRHQFGRRSEQLDADQFQLGLEDIEQTIAENEAAQDATDTAKHQRRQRRDVRPSRNLGALPGHLPRYEVVIDIESRECPCCGGALHPIDELRTEQLDIAPAQLRVRVTRRPRYACRSCEGAVVVAPAPERPIDGGMATEALVAHVVVSKFCDSLPLYRQAQMLARQGVNLDRSTLSNWVGRACWWLMPLYDLVVSTVLSSDKLFADDTALPVLDPGRGRTRTGRLWCYAVDDRPWCGPTHPAAAYVYSEDRKGARPAEHLARFQGVLQVDGYDGFKRIAGDRADGSMRLAFCWAHMRRGFYQFYVSTKSPLAAEVLARIRDLYAIEAEIRGHPADHRRQTREERSRPIVEALHAWLQDQLKRVSAVSDLAKAMRYALRHWPGLIVFLDDGRVEMDTNVVERAIRPHTTPVSLCTSSSSVWKHWKLIAGGDVTRTPFMPGRLQHGRRIQVRGADLERRAGNDLLGAKDTGLDQLAYSMAGYAASLCRLAQGQPGAVLLGGLVGVDTTDPSDRADPVGRPGLVLAGRQAHPVEGRRDILVRPTGGHTPDDRQGIVGGAARVLTSAGFTKTQFGVLSALPMNDQNDLARRSVDIDGDLDDQGAGGSAW
jgi:transposase